MPHALLLSPDDQAVSAITGVLEEMSVTCERPLDGVSAAQKLNSHSFDLVLVDCENLPAAKLIFDVCRRGKNGNSPVPIAIVDGRAGLPTAFRLGAELILTKPVAKDQARSTIRTAVSRVRKDVQTSDSAPAQPESATASAVMTTEGVTEESAMAASAAAASSQTTSFAEPAPGFDPTSVPDAAAATLTAPALSAEMHSAVEDEIDASPVSPELTPQSAAASLSESSPAPAASANSEPKPPLKPSDDPVLAELERTELEESQLAKSQQEIADPGQSAPTQPAAKVGVPVYSSYQQGRKKTRGLLAALLMLALAAGGFYAAWTYQPGFRAIAQPQIDRLLVVAGMALPSTSATVSAKPSTHAAPSATPVLAATSQGSAAGSVTSSATGPTATASSAASAPVEQPATPGAGVAPALSGATNASARVAKPEVNQPSALAKDSVVTPLDTPLPGESSAIILSSEGAEKRLAQSVPPKYPVEARSGATGGTVVLKEVVDENGKVVGVRLVEGNATLAAAAINAVKQWRYRPYIRDGKAQSFQTVVIVDFRRP
ncbi:MAG: TonB family protein [Terriglobales bacterium]